ncbi:MAG: aminotransferase class I/II-fold pyridoxal phosphate-dependent enzyme [Colwellia sp.]|nr:aminotransferase class I/II-fold pyridoxal phosphate-dependent enzyme [Colwellia sp.]
MSTLRFDTIAVRGGYDQQQSRSNEGSICEPAYLSPAQHFETAESMRQTLSGEADGWVYTRIDNPTVRQLETTLAALEGYGSDLDTSATVFSSGMAAIFMAATALVANDPGKTRPNIVLPAACYGGSFMLFRERFERDRGIELRWVANSLDSDAWERAVDADTCFALCEVPSNPLLRMTDISAVSAITAAQNVPLIVDATLSSPALMRPLTMGADIVIHSVSKSMSASGLSIAGAVVSRVNINCNHPRGEMRENFARFLKTGPQRDTGVILSPFNALQSIADLRSLRSRMETMSHSTLRLAQFLSTHSGVIETNYPGLETSPGHAIARRDMILVDSATDGNKATNAYGYLLSIRPIGGEAAARDFLDALNIFWRANDLGRIKSTATIPTISTHSQLSASDKALSDIPGDLVRLSVGCEHVDDIIADVAQALEISTQRSA